MREQPHGKPESLKFAMAYVQMFIENDCAHRYVFDNRKSLLFRKRLYQLN